MENPSNTGEILVIRNDRGRIVSGSLNPNGKPKGTKHFSTYLEEALYKHNGGDNNKQQIIDKMMRALLDRAEKAT